MKKPSAKFFLFMTIVALSIPAANADTINVPGDYPTIQEAIDAAVSGDVINISAGLYEPVSTIIINKDNLVLQGPQADVDPRPSFASIRTAGSPSEAIVDGGGSLDIILSIDAENVIINGLEVKSGTGDMVKQENAHSGTVVKYCIVHDGLGDEGIQLKNSTDGVLEYNYVFEIADPGDALSIAENSSNGVIRYNEVAGIHGENAAIYIYGAADMEIIGNLVRDSGTGGNDGIKVGDKEGSDVNTQNALVQYNTIHDITQDGIAVYMSSVTVECNEIFNCGSENGAIYLAYAISNISIQDNSVHHNVLSTSKRDTVAGILLGEDVDAATVYVNHNTIFDNIPYGLTNEASAAVDATNNWWGDPSGPSGGVLDPVTAIPADGSGNALFGDVHFDPWDITGPICYEYAENGDTLGWSVYDNTPGGATITNVEDLDPGHSSGRAIQLSGSGTQNAYRLINEDETMWGNTDQRVIKWKMKYSEDFYVYIEVDTTAGKRYLYYTPVDNDLLGNSTYVHHGLGADVKDGQWHTFSRDLEADLWDGQPSNNIEEVSGLFIRGTGRIDDVLLYSPDTYLSIEDVSVSEGDGNATFTITADPVPCFNITVNYRTGNGTAVAGEDYLSTKQSVTIPAGESFVQVDIPLIDDSDVEDTENFVVTLSNAINARISDRSGTATISDNDVPPDQIVYEDAENGDTSGWTIYDNVPGGATVTNVLDSDPGHGGTHVIQLWGSGTANAYEFRCDGITGEVGSPWNNTLHTMLQWSMKTLSDFYVYVDVDTTDGNRLLYYTPSNTDLLGTGVYVHHGLGTGVIDGQWHTFERDLLVDLREAQPENNIEAVNGIYIRGNLRIDDIILKEGGPKLSISDASVSEDGGTMVFTITTSVTSPDPITVEYYTMDDTAVAPDDYDAIMLGTATATIDPDGTETQISVTINDDTTWEGFDPETFYVILSNPSSNAGIKDGLGVGSIVEDDPQPPTVYEDAEDGSASRWIVYDATPSGASITNVPDSDPMHGGVRVIAFSGYGTDNAYLLTNGYGAPWHNTTQFVIDWNMKYSEFFYVFVEVETTNGLRYLYYTPVNGNLLGSKDYVHHGLTPAAMDGTWQHFSRNLQQDLKDAQPLNSIEEVNRFFIRGSGMVDDIRLSE